MLFNVTVTAARVENLLSDPLLHTAGSLRKSEMTFQNLLQVVQSCDKFPYDDQESDTEYHRTIPFRLGPHVIGRLLPSTIPKLREYNDRLAKKPFEIKESHIEFASWVTSFDQRTDVVKQLFDTWREEEAFVALAGKKTYTCARTHTCFAR